MNIIVFVVLCIQFVRTVNGNILNIVEESPRASSELGDSVIKSDFSTKLKFNENIQLKAGKSYFDFVNFIYITL